MRFIAALFLITAAGCSTPAKQSSPPVASADPSAAIDAASSPPADTNGVTLDPDWVAVDPRLTALLRVASPVCSTTERFYRTTEFNVHSYSADSPSFAQSDIERRLRDGAKALGLPLARVLPEGPIFRDEARHVTVVMGRAGVTVIVERSPDPWASVRAFAAKSKLEISSLLAELGDDVASKESVLERSSAGRARLQTDLTLPASKRSVLEAWTRKNKIEAVKGGWLRKLRQEAPDVSAILIDVAADKVSISETRYFERSDPACKDHPSRVEKVVKESPDAGPKQSDEELIHIMMGK